jgi:alkylation response protein AidB-like acyl-CoA dehydrogenase
MDELRWTPAETALLERTREFAQAQVAPRASAWVRNRQSCRDLLPAASRVGILGLRVPIEMGGLGLSLRCQMEALRLLAQADFGVAMALINTHNVAEQVSRLAPPPVRKRILPSLLAGLDAGCTAITEIETGSDVAAIQTRAIPDSTGWQINGTKAWVINAQHATKIIVYAQTSAEQRTGGIAAFLIETDQVGFSRRDDCPDPGISSMGVGGLVLEGYVCPHESLIAGPDLAIRDILSAINVARIYVAAMCCGMVEDCLQRAADYGMSRSTFGARLHDHQGWRWTLADAEIELDALRLMIARASQRADHGQDIRREAARAKVFATRMASRHIPALMHAVGAQAFSEAVPFARHLLAAQVAGLVDGSTEMLLERISRDLRP